MDITVRRIGWRPVKSTALNVLSAVGQSVDVLPYGIAFDREWMVARPDGTFITQRAIRDKVAPLPGAARLGRVRGEFLGETLILQAQKLGIEELLRVPRELSPDEVKPVRGQVWASKDLLLHDEGDEAAEWFSRVVEARVRLLRRTPGCRIVNNAFVAGIPDSRHREVSLADGYPFHLISSTSLAAVNAWGMENEAEWTNVPSENFGFAFEIDGDLPWAEDGYFRIRIENELILRFVKPCGRCMKIQERPEGTFDHPILGALTWMGRRHVVRGADGKKQPTVYFGHNLILDPDMDPSRKYKVHVGDRVTVIEPYPGKMKNWTALEGY